MCIGHKVRRNILLTIKYDGTDFCGWQRQPAVPTVQGELEKCLSILCGMPVELSGTSRTDAGVHALGQRAGFSGEFAIPVENIRKAANDMLPASIAVVDVCEMPEDFHARFDARGKKYIYRMNDSGEKDPFRRDYCYFVRRPLDTEAMIKAACYIRGKHDFVCFQAAGGQERKTTVRTVTDLAVVRTGADIDIEITGDGFLYNMVRIIAGTLADVGHGRFRPEEVGDMIESRDRRRAGHTAPPQGLYLAEIYY